MGEAETAVRLGTESWFDDRGLAQVTPFGPVVSFNSTYTAMV